MKLIAIILSIITFTLSTLPCDDESVVSSDPWTSISQNSDSHSHDTTDLCSPFCSCVCCANIVLDQNIQQDNSNLESSNLELNTNYNVSFSSNFLTQIFQPPQV